MNELARKSAVVVAGGTLAWLAIRSAIRASRRIEYAGRNVLITGGSRGLGLEMARRVAEQGANVAICARDASELERARLDLEGRGGRVLALECDVTDPAQIDVTVAKTERRLGPIDVLINNAGIISVGPLESMTSEDFERSLATHFWAPYFATQAVLPGMRARRAGRIVNISSIGGIIPAPHLAPYVAGKFALVGLSKALRAELMRDGIYVTTVCPGLMRTGSPPNAEFKGRHRAEYAWFVLGDSLPGMSVSSGHAADCILKAAQNGEAEAVISVPARVAALAESIAPELMSELYGIVNRLLPGPGGIGTQSRLGRLSESALTRSFLTLLTRHAAARNNESAN